MRQLLAAISATCLLALAGAFPLRAAELIMVEQHGCAYCAAWDRAIAPIYPRTEAGRFAPLRRVQLADGAPKGVTFARPARFTPTFILVDDAGTEIGRIEGYPGEDFFWGLLEKMLAEGTDFAKVNLPHTFSN